MEQYRSAQQTLQMLDELEKSRKKIIVSFATAAALSCAFVIAGFITKLLFYPFSILICIAPVILTTIFSHGAKEEYKRSFKELLVRNSLERTFDDLDFTPNVGMNEYEIMSTHMIKLGNRYSSDDYFKAKYKDTNLEQSDVCIQDVRQTGKSTTTVTYFKGKWMIFDFNKSFRCDLLVCEKGFSYYDKNSRDLEKIELEDIQFNKQFHIYGNNVQEAFYLLTPQIMENIRTLADNTTGDLILVFSKNKLHIGVNNHHNAFEPPLFHKIDVETINSEVYDEINLITQFVDGLKLDKTIYMS